MAGEHRGPGAASVPIDPDLDFAGHYDGGGDPDQSSERLSLWHRAICSLPVAGVPPLQLDLTYDYAYGLLMRTQDGASFRLGSDGIIHTYSTAPWLRRFAPDVAAEAVADRHDFFRVASTIGGYLLFPRNGPGQSGPSINQARGVHPQIADRFDLTLECIRRHYPDPTIESPLAERLAYYGGFFAIFGDFDTYLRFFLLEDMVTAILALGL